MVSRIAKAFQDYFTKMAVASFGMHIFNEGLKQTLRLNFQEFEESRSGETLRSNYYGWFDRIERGKYKLRPEGAAALTEYGDVIAEWAASVSSSP